MTTSTEPSVETPRKAPTWCYRVEVKAIGPTLPLFADVCVYLMEECLPSEEELLTGLMERVGEEAMAVYRCVAEQLRQEGRLQRDRELAQRLLDRGFAAAEVAELVGMNLVDVEYLAMGSPPSRPISLEEAQRRSLL